MLVVGVERGRASTCPLPDLPIVEGNLVLLQ